MDKKAIEEGLIQAEKDAEAKWAEVYPAELPAEEVGAEAASEEPGLVAAPALKPAEPAEPEDGVKPKEPAEEGKLTAEEETYKQKFLVMEGKFKAEVPRMAAELAQWKEFAGGGLQSRVADLEAQVKVIPKAEPPAPEPDDEVEAFVMDNPGAAKLINRLKEEHKAEIATLRSEISSVGKKAGDVESKVEHTTTMDRFDRAMALAGVPDWREIDNSPEFADWLPLSKARQLQEAASAFDAQKTAVFFLDYKKSLNPDGNGDIPPDNGNGKSKLDKFTAPPGGGGKGPPPRQTARPVLTRDMYQRFSLQAMKPQTYVAAQWGGRTIEQMDTLFNTAIAKGELG